MICNKCGSTLNANGICPVCSVPASDPGKGLGIASMAVGIASVVSGGAIGIVGLILSTMAKKKSAAAGFSNTFAKVGFITSLISVISTAVGVLALVAYYIFLFVLMFASYQ